MCDLGGMELSPLQKLDLVFLNCISKWPPSLFQLMYVVHTSNDRETLNVCLVGGRNMYNIWKITFFVIKHDV